VSISSVHKHNKFTVVLNSELLKSWKLFMLVIIDAVSSVKDRLQSFALKVENLPLLKQ